MYPGNDDPFTLAQAADYLGGIVFAVIVDLNGAQGYCFVGYYPNSGCGICGLIDSGYGDVYDRLHYAVGLSRSSVNAATLLMVSMAKWA